MIALLNPQSLKAHEEPTVDATALIEEYGKEAVGQAFRISAWHIRCQANGVRDYDKNRSLIMHNIAVDLASQASELVGDSDGPPAGNVQSGDT